MGRRTKWSRSPIHISDCIRALAAVSFLAVALPLAASDFDIVLSEVHYHPFGSGDPKFEFVEIHNGGVAPVDLGGWMFTEGIDFVIPPGTVLEPGAFLAVSPNAAALRSEHPSAAVTGNYSGRLDNGGESVVLSNPSGRPVSRVHYRDGGAWSSLADGKGASLELLILHGDVDRPAVWAPSRRLGGTPGGPNTRDAEEFPHAGMDPASLLRLNEVKSAAVDGAGFVELWNGGLQESSLGGHRLLESSGQDYTFPAGTRIPAGGFLVVPTETLGFAPSGESSEWLLLAADGEVILDAFEARATPAAFGTGRHPDGGNDGFVMPPSRGAPNLFQADDRVVLNEIFYAARFEAPSGNCFDDCSDRRQWIELLNRSGSDIDLGGWTLDGGIGYTFPPGTRLLAGEILVVAASRAAFLEDHPAVAPAPGEWSASLGRREDTIILRDALGNAADLVHYGNGDPYNDIAGDGRDDRTVTSSDWPTDVSDSGRSIELLHPSLENEAGRAWRRGPVGGTPGMRNSVFDDDDPLPVAFGVRHFPAVPRSTEPVLVTCRAHAVSSIQSVELEWRIEGEGAESIVALRDDGVAGDAIAGDSVFSGRVPPVPDGSIVAFRVILTSASGKEDVYPPRPASGNRTPFYLYEVDDTPSLHNGSVDYRVILSAADLNTLHSRPESSDVLLNATFIGDGQVHHMAVIRYRGENSRGLPRKAYHIAFPPEDTFQDMQVLNLQPSNRDGGIEVTGLQDFLAADLFRRQGLPYPQEWPVNLHFAGGVLPDLEGRLDVDPMYVRKEHMNREFLDRYFDGSDGGNLYRALDPLSGLQGDLSYRGEDPADYVEIYEKRSNRDEDDYSDIIELTRAFDSDETPNAEFESEMRRLIDVEQWASFFAIQDFITNIDGGIQTQIGEDYFLYRVPDDSARRDAGLWLIIPWDIEETFADPNAGLFLPEVAASRRFLRHQAFAPLYLAALNDLRSAAGSRREMRKSYAHARDIYPAAVADQVTADLDTYVTRRNQVIGSQIASGLEAAIRSGPPAGTKVMEEGDTWAYWKGVREPSDGALDWSSVGFDDESWERGPSGFGYGDGDDATILDDMEAGNGNAGYLSLYVRRTFDIADPAAVGSLSLVVDYDDAFVAYLNGIEAARSPGMAGVGTEGEPVPFDHLLGDSTNHEASRGGNNPNAPESFALDDARGILVPGQNVLAIHAFNSTRDSSDFSLIPELVRFEADSVPGGGWGREIFAGGASAELEGIANPATTRSVKVGGILATITGRPPGSGPPYALLWQANVPLASSLNRVRIEGFSGPNGTGVVVETADVVIHRLDEGLTDAVGPISGAVTWKRDDGPYVVSSGLRVNAGASLRIEPGTRVLFAGGVSLTVNGVLDASGTAGEPILFGSLALAPWGGIHLASTGTGDADPVHVLRHVRVEHGSAASGQSACLSLVGAKARVEDCSFTSLTRSAIDSRNSRLEVADSVFEDVRGGVAGADSTVIVSASTFLNVQGGNDAIRLRGNGTGRSRIEGSFIEGSEDDGLELVDASVDVARNTVRSIADRACLLDGEGLLGPSAIDGNVFHDAEVGLELRNGSIVGVGSHDTIVSCRTGLALSGDPQAQEPGLAAFHSMILWHNEASVAVEGDSSLDLEWSDVDWEPVWPGAGNLSADPRFRDMSTGDFGLAQGSPCLRAGKDGSDMGATGGGTGGPAFLRGDATDDGVVNLTDAITILDYLFSGVGALECEKSADTDDNGTVNLTDVIHLLDHLFRGGQAVSPPYPEVAPDPTEDDLGCR